MTPADGITLAPLTTGIALLLIAWMLLGEPLYGRFSFRQFLAALGRGDPNARRRFYARWSAGLWLLALITVSVAGLDPGFGPHRLGFRWPDLAALGHGTTAAVLVGFALGLLGAAVAGFVAVRRGKGSATVEAPAAGSGDPVLAMLPRTRAERWGFAGLSVTAGVTEEIVWRGFLIAALVALLPSVPTAGYVVICAIVFGWAHLYQGIRGVLATALAGGVLTFLYLTTSSLLLPVLLHALLDLRALLIPLPTARQAPSSPRMTG